MHEGRTGRATQCCRRQTACSKPVVGADLQPGLYKLRLWTACTPTVGQKTSVTLLIKPPSELNLRGVTAVDLLHKAQ